MFFAPFLPWHHVGVFRDPFSLKRENEPQGKEQQWYCQAPGAP